ISNLLQKQCFNPNSHEEFDLKLTPSMAVFRLENLIKTAWTISSSKGGQNSATSTDGNVGVGSERIAQKRNSDEVEIINSVPAKRPPQQSPLAACKQCVDNVTFTQCTTSASLSYTASLPQTVPNNYPLHSNIAMAPNSAAAYPVMFAGSQPLIPHINQIQSSGASNTSNSRSMCPPIVSLQPPRYSTIHTAVPNQCSQTLLPRATVPQAVHNSQPTLMPNIYITNGIFEPYQQQTRSQVNFQPQPNIQSQSMQMNSRRDNRVNSIRTTPVGSELTHQQPPSQSSIQLNVMQHRTIASNLPPQIPQKPVPETNMIQPKTVPVVPVTQRSQMPQVSISKQKIVDQKIAQKQNMQLVTLLPPSSEKENIDARKCSQNSVPGENGTNTASQLHDLLSKNSKNNDNNCQIYPPVANGQQSQATVSFNLQFVLVVNFVFNQSTIGLFQGRQTTASTEPAAAGVDGSVIAPVKSKTHTRIQSPPSPPVTEKPAETQSNVTSSVDTENGSVTSSTANGTKTMISKRKAEVTTEVVSTTENGYKITFTPSTNGLSSDTETLQESNIDADDDDDAENDIFCAVCKDGGELFMCETCPRSFHMNCHIPILRTMPNAAWTCQLCNTIPADIHRSIGPNASQVNQVACQRILLEMYCLKESEAMRKETTRNNLKTVKDNLENKSNYTEQDFIRDINTLFRGFYSEQKVHNEQYESAIVLEKKFKELVESYLPQHKSMVKMKIWEIGSNSRLKKPRN
ncbi:E3 ubiquitin-protein ligase TRIM33-like isoform X2, partial [Leptotrombidium deliense]